MPNDEDSRKFFLALEKEVEVDDFRELMRKLGCTGNDLKRWKSKSGYEMLVAWNQKAGRFCKELSEIVSRVVEEVRQGKRDPAVDSYFNNAEKPHLLCLYRARDMAWFQYTFIKQYPDIPAYWNDVALSPDKFNLLSYDVSVLRRKYEDDPSEAMLQSVIKFMNRETISTVQDIVIKMNELNLTIPEGYEDRESTSTHDNQRTNNSSECGVRSETPSSSGANRVSELVEETNVEPPAPSNNPQDNVAGPSDASDTEARAASASSSTDNTQQHQPHPNNDTHRNDVFDGDNSSGSSEYLAHNKLLDASDLPEVEEGITGKSGKKNNKKSKFWPFGSSKKKKNEAVSGGKSSEARAASASSLIDNTQQQQQHPNNDTHRDDVFDVDNSSGSSECVANNKVVDTSDVPGVKAFFTSTNEFPLILAKEMNKDDWSELMRKLGCTGSDLKRWKSKRGYKLLVTWNQKGGKFCEKLRNVTPGLVEEVRQGRRDPAVNGYFTNDEKTYLLCLLPGYLSS